MGTPYEMAAVAANALRDRLGEHESVLVLGSGWAGAARELGPAEASVTMPELPGFPEPAVLGHSGIAQSISVDGARALVLAGRAHFYEGHLVETVVHGVRSAVLAGCERVILTNAAGSLNDATPPGTPVVISDHLNLTGTNPMTGVAPPADLPDRFVDLAELYSPRLRAAARDAVPGICEGVYAGLLGGSYETPAEIRMLQGLGADLVGMSTVLEAIAARHLGAEVFGASFVTNMGAGLSDVELDHEDVLAKGRAATASLAGLLRAVITSS
ncbi:MAG: purine-nucleoside phosphorylase [Thermoleophilia bacterium]|nr:purine-nucleoside phosphorylase [Thermoleophilia bacterium]MDH3724970.1 purine-nucleoside phosphorylase [Thermoleophilia bacterium]